MSMTGFSNENIIRRDDAGQIIKNKKDLMPTVAAGFQT